MAGNFSNFKVFYIQYLPLLPASLKLLSFALNTIMHQAS